MTPDVAMIFAAGFGTRMGALVKDRPKPLLEIAGTTLIDLVLDQVQAAGIPRAVVNAHYLADMLAAHLRARESPQVTLSREAPEVLETGGGLRQALPLLGEGPVFIGNSDVVWSGVNPFETLAENWDASRMDGLVLLVPRKDATAHTGPGDFFMADEGRLTWRGSADAAPYIYSGAQILKPGEITQGPAGAFSILWLMERIRARGRLFGVIYRGGWVDVSTPPGLEAARAANQP